MWANRPAIHRLSNALFKGVNNSVKRKVTTKLRKQNRGENNFKIGLNLYRVCHCAPDDNDRLSESDTHFYCQSMPGLYIF